jgi:photosystem II stability/assembly factor-like uncharacterized protein
LAERPGSELLQDRDLYSISFSGDGMTGWIAGEDGLLFHTGDGGKTWQKQKSPITTAIFNVGAIDSARACAAGSNGVLLWTSDGGGHWQIAKATQFANFDLFDIAFSGESIWAAAQFGTIINSADNGKTWLARFGGKHVSALGALFAVAFSDGMHGWSAGLGGELLATADGGVKWKNTNLKTPYPIYSIVVSEKGDVWLGGYEGFLAKVNPEQMREQQVATHTASSLTAIAFSGVLGVATGMSGTLLVTGDGGTQWQLLTPAE